jgi:hypothetical protein
MSKKVDKLVASIDEAVTKALFIGNLKLSQAEFDELYVKVANRLAFHAGDYIGMFAQGEDEAEQPLADATAAMREQAMVYAE